MTEHELFRKLLAQAPPPLAAAIYDRVRRSKEGEGGGPSWQEIVQAARELGIFTAEEAAQFLQLISGGIPDAA